MGTMITILLIGAIALYCGYIIGKRIKQAKEGNFCGGNCGSCGSACPSAEKKKEL